MLVALLCQPLLLKLLATELANEGKELHIRQLAGVVLKNCVTTSDHASTSEEASASRADKSAKWLAIGRPERDEIKALVRAAELKAAWCHPLYVLLLGCCVPTFADIPIRFDRCMRAAPRLAAECAAVGAAHRCSGGRGDWSDRGATESMA